MAKLLRLSAIVAIVATIAGVAITSQGFDVQDVNLNNRTIWILQTGEGQRYGQVNTSLMELTSANSAEAPSGLMQSPKGVVLYLNGDSRYADVNTAEPADFTKEDLATQTKALKDPLSMDMGDTSVVYVGKDGELYVSNLVVGTVTEPTAVAKPDEKKPDQKFQAATIATDGKIFAFSKDDGTIRQFDPLTQGWTNYREQTPAVNGTKFQMAMVGDRWVLMDEESGNLWIRGNAAPISTPPGGQLQRSSKSGTSVYIAEPNGLVAVEVEGAKTFKQVFEQFAVERQTTKPVDVNGEIFATWLDERSGAMYSSKTKKVVELNFNGREIKSTPMPTIQSNGQTAVINDRFSGWAWRLPDGSLIESTQNWSLVDKVPDQTSNNAEVTKVNTPKSPVAENDQFGVRANQLVALPVLMNDHDANNDIVSIIPDSVQGLESSFGTVRVSNNEQMLVVEVKAGVHGSANFTYKITDGTGTAPSKSASVSLRVVAPDKNSQPAWCTDVDPECLQTWPKPQVEPGGEIVVPVLNGWVDPEGDRIFVSAAEVAPGKGNVGFTPAGEIVFQDTNPSATSQSTVPITVHISDVRGKESVKQLTVSVNPDPTLTLAPFVVSTSVKEPKLVDVRKYTSGQSGDVMITSLKAQNNADHIQIEQIDSYTFKVVGDRAGETVLRVGISDEVGEVSSFIRVNVVDGEGEKISTQPVTVLVSPGLDSSVNLFAAAHNPTGKALVISNLKVSPVTNGALYANLIKGGFLRVRGKTPQDTTGLIGVVRYTISDGSGQGKFSAQGEAFVYEMPQPGDNAPVGITDNIVVRAGQTAEVDVLANDVGSPGVPLLIDSKSFKPDCLDGGLIFSGSGKVRLVAPLKPGTYYCSYSIYASGSPKLKGAATMRIRVIEVGSNQAPLPQDVSGRVRAGDSVSIAIPLVGVDPDGDTASILSVGSANPDKGFVALNEERNGLIYSSVPGAKGQDEFEYVLVDSNGMKSQPARVRVAIIDSEPEIAPVTMVDYAEIIAGAGNKVVIDPISNDFDPQPKAGSALSLVEGSVLPDAGAESKNYGPWASAVTKVDKNKITFTASDQPETMRFVYTVKNSSGSKATGQITIRVSKDASDYAPEVTDTYITPAEMLNLASGIDVVNRKVSWPTGDIGALKLSIWGDPHGFTVTGGTKLAATAAPADPTLVVFKLSGVDYKGKEVESYAFMHVPGANPVITLDPDKARQTVKENSSVDFHIDELVNLPGQIEVKSSATLGIRGNAKCENKGNGNLTYNAGAGSPWRDGCVIELKIKGAQSFSTVMVPITVEPENPEPELQKHQEEVIPGPSHAIEFDLKDMTTWLDHPNLEGLVYDFSGGSDLFKLSLSGSILKIEAYGNSASGLSSNVKIRITNHEKTAPANLVLVVGAAPNEAPVGGLLTLACKVNEGQDACKLQQDEMNRAAVNNPYQGTALRFAPFDYKNGEANYNSKGNVLRCSNGVTLRATSDSIYAVWSTDKTPSSVQCLNKTYYVLDRENRLGKGELNFTLDGVPGSVKGVKQTGYTATSIKIQISPPNPSDPPVEGFNIYDETKKKYEPCEIASDGGPTTCWIHNQVAYDGTNENVRHIFRVFAYNSMGESSLFQELNKPYAYRAPRAITSDVFVNVVPKYDPKTTAQVGIAAVTISPVNDSNVKAYEIQSEGNQKITHVISGFANFTELVPAKPGLKTKITVKAIGRVNPPDGSNTTESSAYWTGLISGSPSVSSVKAETFKSGNTWFSRVVAKGVNRNFSEKTANIAFILYVGNTAPTCDWIQSSNSIRVNTTSSMKALVQTEPDGNVDQQINEMSSRDLNPILENTTYTPMVCYTNGFGKILASGASVSTLGDPGDGVYKYAVTVSPTDGAWLVTAVTNDNRSGVHPEFNGSKTDTSEKAWNTKIYSEYFGEKSIIRVRYCLDSSPKTCSNGDRLVPPSDPSRAFQMRVTSAFFTDSSGVKIGLCSKGRNLYFGVEGDGLVTSGGVKLWQGDTPIGSASAPQYSTDGGTNWTDMDDYGAYFRIPNNAGSVNKIRLFVKGSNSGAQGVRGLTGEAPVTFTCTN